MHGWWTFLRQANQKQIAWCLEPLTDARVLHHAGAGRHCRCGALDCGVCLQPGPITLRASVPWVVCLYATVSPASDPAPDAVTHLPEQEQTLDPANQTEGDTKEGFYFGREVRRPSARASTLGKNWARTGHTPGTCRLAASLAPHKDASTFLQVSDDSPEASKPLHGPNQWPEESLLPGLRSVYSQYSEELRLLGMRCRGGGRDHGLMIEA